MLLTRQLQQKRIARLVYSTIFIGGVFVVLAGFVAFRWVSSQEQGQVGVLESMAIYANVVSNESIIAIPEKYGQDSLEDPRNTELFKKKVSAARSFFTKYNAPLAANAEDFVRAADLYGLDYRLLPAISMVESTGGKKLFRAYNPFGWGRSGYSSFKEAIYDVARGMARYYKAGLTRPESIAYKYNPVTPESWGRKVRSLMSQMPAL